MTTVIFDIGNSHIRVGIAGDIEPSHISLIDSAVVGSKDEIIWSNYLSHIFIDILRIKPKECRLLVIEDICNLEYIRNLIFRISIYELQFQAISFQPNIYLPAIVCECVDAVVVDIGADCCRVVTIADRRPQLNTLKFTSVGSNHCFEELQQSLNMFHQMNHVSREIFEQTCYLPQNYNLTPDFEVSTPLIHCLAAQGTVDIPASYTSACFLPLILGLSRVEGIVDDTGGVVGAIINSINSCSQDIRAKVSQNIIICGGGASISGLSEAVCHELTQAVKARYPNYLIKLPANKFQPKSTPFPLSHLAWIGGSIFASLKSNDIKFVSVKELTDANMKRTGTGNSKLTIPDWLSIAEEDWVFYGPAPVNDEHVIAKLTQRTSDMMISQNKPANTNRRSLNPLTISRRTSTTTTPIATPAPTPTAR